MNKVRGFIRLIRFVNCLMMGFAVIVGAAMANPQFNNVGWLNFLYGFITGFTLTAASMVFNDYYDRRIDAINEPSRPIPSGLISSKEALIFASFLSFSGFIFSLLVSVYCFSIAVLAWLIFVIYTTIGKRSGLPGNFLVSLCVAIPFIYGSVVATNSVQINIFLFALMAFLSNTGRELTKGIVDVPGDRVQGVRTLAVRFGEKSTAIFATLFYASAVLLSSIPVVLRLVSFWFVPFAVVLDTGLVAFSFLLIKDYSRENARRIKNIVLYWSIFGLLAFLFGVLG